MTTPTLVMSADSTATRPCEIDAYLHCGKCLDEYLRGFMNLDTGDVRVPTEGDETPDTVEAPIRELMAPKDYARTQAGLTASGAVQVWCNRHDCNVAVLTPRVAADGTATAPPSREGVE